jgi:hypothetical protein
MHSKHREALEKHFNSNEWYGRTQHGQRLLKTFATEDWEIRGWTRLRARTDAHGKAQYLRTRWGRGKEDRELLFVDVHVGTTVKAAHDELFETLSNIQSAVVERRTDTTAVGDVTFALKNTMILFARANVVVWVRNAGPKVVPVTTVARDIDAEIVRRLGGDSDKGPAAGRRRRKGG